eukprot:TRINITY_DN4396_c0_g1_i3.p1 TRINITY_DN4396_c0_g1~~TRINITY_DN4396_c0_g1_i3.p1  ORF type:complete len:235 (+),score=39.24 TRINITY_DN4396_c0_g1_i3:420-1124(+)
MFVIYLTVFQNSSNHMSQLRNKILTGFFQRKIVRLVLDNEEDNTHLTLIYGNRDYQQILLRDELKQYRNRFPDRFNVIFVVGGAQSEEFSQDSNIVVEHSELITPSILKKYLANVNVAKERVQIVLCGGPKMERALVDSLANFLGSEFVNGENVFAFSVQTKVSTPTPVSLPRKPQANECCGQMCPNCVWLEYLGSVHALIKSGKMAQDQLISEVESLDIDPSVKSFLEMELKR